MPIARLTRKNRHWAASRHETTYRRVIGRSGAISTDEAGRKLPIVSTIPGTDGHGSCEFQWNSLWGTLISATLVRVKNRGSSASLSIGVARSG